VERSDAAAARSVLEIFMIDAGGFDARTVYTAVNTLRAISR
jgi:hypothetical protein